MMKFNKKGETDNIYRLKIVMVGPEGAGFDGFLGHLHKSKQDFSSTLGVNIYTDRIFQEGRRFQINIWHLTEPTDEKAKNARSLFIMGANAVIVLYDGSKKNGLRDAESYVKEIKESFPPSIPRILVGNLVSGREVKFQDA